MSSPLRADAAILKTARPVRQVRAESANDSFAPLLYPFLLLMLACAYHWLLCLAQTFGIRATPTLVGLVELMIYAGCLPFLLKRLSMRVLTAILFMIGAITAMAILRGGYLDIKGIRDLLIPAIFLWAGRSWAAKRGDTAIADLDRILRVIVVIIIGVGMLEAMLPGTYSRYINSFTYYAGLGGISEASAQITGQTVTLNGLRPQGIGRTLLPQLLGNSRISSVFLEPVSFGNFAVLTLAWALAKPTDRKSVV